jgi:predicted dehydrogenase
VKRPGPQPEFAFEKLPAPATEPLRAELDAFIHAVQTRQPPVTNGAAGRAALDLASRVMASILAHAESVHIFSTPPAPLAGALEPLEKRAQ